MSLSCAIIDDEYLAIKVVQEYANSIADLTVQKTFVNPEEALEYLQCNKVDLIFIDIQMPYLNGFELLQHLPQPPMVVFTTARHDFAVQAFALDVLDYLVKPISPERFLQAVNKAREYLAYRSFQQSRQSQGGYLMIKSDYRIYKIMTDSIFYIEGLSEYVKIFTTDKMHVTLAALKDLIQQLPATQFIRVHKSYIVSRQHITSFSHQSIILRNDKVIPIGRIYKETFRREMEK